MIELVASGWAKRKPHSNFPDGCCENDSPLLSAIVINSPFADLSNDTTAWLNLSNPIHPTIKRNLARQKG